MLLPPSLSEEEEIAIDKDYPRDLLGQNREEDGGFPCGRPVVVGYPPGPAEKGQESYLAIGHFFACPLSAPT